MPESEESRIRPTIAIVGAGITGLLAAHGLKKLSTGTAQHGFPVVVFDRDPDPGLDSRARDWTILIHWAMPLMERLLPADIVARLPEAVTTPHLEFTEDVETLPRYHGKTGELVFNNKTPFGRRVSRRRLRALLLEGLEEDVQWGKKLVSLSRADEEDAPVLLAFEDGGTHEADFVLGADGASSAVRRELLGAEKSAPGRSGTMVAMGIVEYKDEAKVKAIVDTHPVAAIMMGSGVVAAVGVMRADDPHDMASWSTVWSVVWKGGEGVELEGQDALEFAKDFVRRSPELYCEPFASAVRWAPDGSLCYVNELRYWVPVPWNNQGGRITLVGDACHAMLPFRGQGLQMAIVDASTYLEAIIEIDKCGKSFNRIRDIMASFEAEMIPRGAEAVQQSLAEASKAMDPSGLDKMLMVTRGHGRLG